MKKILIEDDKALLKINPRIYPVDVVQAAAYILIDKAFILLDGDPNKEITAEIRGKKGEDVKSIVKEFNEELLSYAVYKSQSEKNRDLREAILKRVLLTNEVMKAVDELKKEIKNENKTQ